MNSVEMVRVTGQGMCDVNKCPHKNGYTDVCMGVFVCVSQACT